MTDSKLCLQVRVEGRVQGVGYRAWVERTATDIGLQGWVRNRRDGAVEAVFQGTPDKVEDMIVRCRTGPPAAIVTSISVTEAEIQSLSDFGILPTE